MLKWIGVQETIKYEIILYERTFDVIYIEKKMTKII